MTTIKLNNYYPHLTECITLEVSEEIAVTLSIGGRQCDSYKRRQREHDECSLDGLGNLAHAPPQDETGIDAPGLDGRETIKGGIEGGLVLGLLHDLLRGQRGIGHVPPLHFDLSLSAPYRNGGYL